MLAHCVLSCLRVLWSHLRALEETYPDAVGLALELKVSSCCCYYGDRVALLDFEDSILNMQLDYGVSTVILSLIPKEGINKLSCSFFFLFPGHGKGN